MKRLLSTALAALLLAAPAQAVDLDQPAPPLTATLLDGSAWDLAAHKGDVVIVNFWATWCVPCRAELPAFAEFQRKHQAEGVTVLALSMDDPEDLAKVRHVAADLPFAVGLYGDAATRPYGRIWRLPITFIVGRDGVLRYDGGRGEMTSFDLAGLEKVVGPLLAR